MTEFDATFVLYVAPGILALLLTLIGLGSKAEKDEVERLKGLITTERFNRRGLADCLAILKKAHDTLHDETMDQRLVVGLIKGKSICNEKILDALLDRIDAAAVHQDARVVIVDKKAESGNA